MKNRNFFYFLLAVACLFGSGGLACSPCNGMECGKHGGCDEATGSCVCETGYEANMRGLCDSLSYLKFMGNYTVTDGCQTSPYMMTISRKIPQLTQIELNNFAGYENFKVVAAIESNKIMIPAQSMEINGSNFSLTALQSYMTKADELTFSYILEVNGTPYQCEMNMVK